MSAQERAQIFHIFGYAFQKPRIKSIILARFAPSPLLDNIVILAFILYQYGVCFF